MLRVAASRAAGALRPSSLRAAAGATAARPFSVEGKFGDKERAEERIHFLKEDERLLRKLLSKIKAQADTVDVHEAAGAQASELSSLKAIVGKYNVAQADLDKLLDWKHAH